MSNTLLTSLPAAVYRCEQVREMDNIAITQKQLSGETLMQRAGGAALLLLQQLCPLAKRFAIVCGVGNNGGDGYVLADKLLQRGLHVVVYRVGDHHQLKGDAYLAANAFLNAGGVVDDFSDDTKFEADVIVDGIFGTGFSAPISSLARQAVIAINQSNAFVLALDIPSGLSANTGMVEGDAVIADATLSFIALKQGLFTGMAASYAGQIYNHDLEVGEDVIASQTASAHRLLLSDCQHVLKKRQHHQHKGDFGHVVVVGGEPGFMGAIQMAGLAALRVGAGLVSCVTDPEHAASLATHVPELMAHGVTDVAQAQPVLAQSSVIVVGPGLGHGARANTLWQAVLAAQKPMVVDADALTLLASEPKQLSDSAVITPHPGEAARLLATHTKMVQADRFAALTQLRQQYGAVTILKGSGTLIADHAQISICDQGGAFMASGGMGDILSGVVGGLMAQGVAPHLAARYGVMLHAHAAEQASKVGERGLIATDLLTEIRALAQ